MSAAAITMSSSVTYPATATVKFTVGDQDSSALSLTVKSTAKTEANHLLSEIVTAIASVGDIPVASIDNESNDKLKDSLATWLNEKLTSELKGATLTVETATYNDTASPKTVTFTFSVTPEDGEKSDVSTSKSINVDES